MISFAHPIFFILILFIPVLLFFSNSSGGRIRFSSLNLIKKSSRSSQYFHPRSLLKVLRALTLILFICALARPQKGKTFSEVNSEGIDIILALDTSLSMQALDFKIDGNPVDRLTIVKQVVQSFIKERKGDRMGLVVFGEEAFTQCPLTLDHGILVDFVDKMEIGMAGQATAIGQSIGLSINRLKDVTGKSKIIILLTDGSNTAGVISPLKAAELAKKFNVKIYTIGVGTKGKAPFLVNTILGKQYEYREVEIDEKTLKEMADLTGGRYFRATDKTELEGIYKEIDSLEKTEIKVKEYTEYNEIFAWFLLPGLIFLLLEIILSQTLLRKIP